MVRGFSHVQLAVRDVAASARWYRAVLELEQFTDGAIASGPYVGLRHPTAGFVVGLHTAGAPSPDIAPAVIDHLSFAVDDPGDLESRRVELLAQGFDVGEIFDEVASANLRLRDPDGLTVELTAPHRRA